jgi:ubiquinone/menaquinone biosynthesis C-methylase UbiE
MRHDPAAVAYASTAPFYDRFTAGHDHGAWVRTLEEVARAHGLRGRRLLDVACGTGNSLIPLIERGYDAAGCDISSEMLERAREKLGPDANLFAADVRRLPTGRRYDLVTCIGDVLNYLLDPPDLGAALRSLAAVLAPGGICLFDANTLGAYRSIFAHDHCLEDPSGLITWRGGACRDAAPGATAEVLLDAFTREDGHWTRATSRHIHRHHPANLIDRAIATAGLRRAAVYGVTPDGVLHAEPNELVHTKRLYVVSTS